MSCTSLQIYRRFGGTRRLDLHVRRIRQKRNRHEVGSKQRIGDFQQNPQRYIPRERILDNRRSENIVSYMIIMMMIVHSDRAMQIEWSAESILNWAPVCSYIWLWAWDTHCSLLYFSNPTENCGMLPKGTCYSLQKKIYEYIQMRQVSGTTASEKLH
jgi:hypothetical protein